MSVETFIKIADRFGVPVAILVFVGLVTGYIVHRCFGKSDGLFTMLAARQVVLMDSLECSQQKQTTNIVTMCSSISDITRATSEILDFHRRIPSWPSHAETVLREGAARNQLATEQESAAHRIVDTATAAAHALVDNASATADALRKSNMGATA